ncbi:MAG: hypothetical protein IIX43_05430 [Bacteroidales bacterium]|nr:hypothetical protein [Bacteroidales bacterium]
MNKGTQNYGFNLKRRGITTEKRTSKKVSPTTTLNYSIKRIPVFDLRYIKIILPIRKNTS